MAYVSLYRKYRPQTFEDVVGQEHVTTTLRNAISEERIASGYLFTGTRGTAKTTCARILAKALNCIGKDGQRTSPTPEPCGVCGPCRAITASAFVDVLELDAASHGKVDDVREIVANIKFPPMEGRYKVYIIDEAHQLSRDAMDAFLKTLEEPPDRVLFVLATTELEKLPITIASRCQVFEFKRGSVAQIASRLTKVLAEEKVTAEPSAITLVARAADGSYRDSLSLLEQVLAYKRDQISPRDVSLVLGTVDEDLLARTVGLIASSDAAGLFALAGDILASGRDVRQFLRSLATRFRDMLFVGVGASVAEPGDIADSASLRQQAAQFAPDALLQALEILADAERETKTNPQHRLVLEMALLRLVRLPSVASAPAAFVAPPPAVSNGIAAAPAPLNANESGDLASDLADAEAVDSLLPDDALPPDDVLPPDDEDSLTLLPGDDVLDDAPLPIVEDDSPGLFDDAPSLVVTSADEHEQADDLLQVQHVPAAPPVAELPRPVEPSPDTPPDLRRLQKSWQEVVNRLGSRAPSSVGIIRDGHPAALVGSVITLEFVSRFPVEKLETNDKARKLLEEVINKTLDVEPGTYRVKAALRGTSAPVKLALGAAPKAHTSESEAHSPLMDEVIAVFGGRVFDDSETQ